MMTYQYAILAVFVIFAIAEARNGKLFKKATEVKSDGMVELMSSILLFVFTQPVVLFTSGFLAALTFPQYAGVLADTSIWLQIGLLLIFDDLLQYWWHRASHNSRFLYFLHRAHHNAKYMSVRIVYRNNFFYYLFMPSIWCSGILIYLGLGWVYAAYLVFKLTVITGAHSEWKWDRGMYKLAAQYPILEPIVWVIERTISTPSTHSAHHGLTMEDGVTNYKGNYGNLLFFWDVLFGTAHITRRYPENYGIEGMRKAEWPEQLFWPIIKSQKKAKPVASAPVVE